MQEDREPYRIQSACKLITKGSHMALTILAADCGLPPNADGSFLEFAAYSASVYEFAALPYLKDAGEVAPMALGFIARGIEQGGDWAQFASLDEVFGADLNAYRALLDVPGGYYSPEGVRADFMMESLRGYRHLFDAAFEGFARNHNPSSLMNKIAHTSTTRLSERLYGFDTIGDEFYKNQYAFFQSVIERQTEAEQRIYGAP